MDDGTYSDWFDMDQGLRQGCNLAPLLFDLFFATMLMVSAEELAKDDEVTAEMAKVKRKPWGKVGGHEGGGHGAAVGHTICRRRGFRDRRKVSRIWCRSSLAFRICSH